jgi:Tfp pilus assembly protein PilF
LVAIVKLKLKTMKLFYHLLLCIGICLCSLKANSQFNYKPAKLITLTNDTLAGYINDGGLFRNQKYCTYKKDKHSKPERYYPKDIKGYQLNNGAYFSSQFNREIDSVNMFFADVLIEGKYTLYHSNKANDLLFFIKTDSGKMVISGTSHRMLIRIRG